MPQAITTYRPGLLGSRVFDDVFSNFFNEWPTHIQQTTKGYPLTDIYRSEDGSTIIEFALAGFSKEDLSVDINPDKRSITVSANAALSAEETTSRRIAKRSFQKTYVNYDNGLDLSNTTASYENGLLTIAVPKHAESEPLSISIK